MAAHSWPQYNALLARIQPGTRLYTYVAQATDGMIWAPVCRFDEQTIRVDNARRVGEDCFFCTAELSAEVTAGYWAGPQVFTVSRCYQLAFVKENGAWLCAAMADVQ